MARILYNFYLEPVDYTKDIKIMSDLVLRPAHPVYTKFIKIDRPWKHYQLVPEMASKFTLCKDLDNIIDNKPHIKEWSTGPF